MAKQKAFIIEGKMKGKMAKNKTLYDEGNDGKKQYYYKEGKTAKSKACIVEGKTAKNKTLYHEGKDGKKQNPI